MISFITRFLLNTYGMTRQEAEVSIRSFLLQLAKKNLLEIVTPGLDEKEKRETLFLHRMKIP